MSGQAPAAAPRPAAGTLPPRDCGWCGRKTRDWVVQAASDGMAELVWCRDAEPCQTLHADREAAARAT